MTLDYYARDERPYWRATVEVEGQFEDLSTGYTFEVNIGPSPVTATSTPVLTKTVGITGGPDGLVTVAWVDGDLDLDPGTYSVQLTAVRTSDGKDWTVQDKIKIRPRLT